MINYLRQEVSAFCINHPILKRDPLTLSQCIIGLGQDMDIKLSSLTKSTTKIAHLIGIDANQDKTVDRDVLIQTSEPFGDRKVAQNV
ncbi:hypothetical protein QE439_001477 [Pedobacter agri]|nr:hypothetical protein [Pedobacter agri]